MSILRSPPYHEHSPGLLTTGVTVAFIRAWTSAGLTAAHSFDSSSGPPFPVAPAIAAAAPAGTETPAAAAAEAPAAARAAPGSPAPDDALLLLQPVKRHAVVAIKAMLTKPVLRDFVDIGTPLGCSDLLLGRQSSPRA